MHASHRRLSFILPILFYCTSCWAAGIVCEYDSLHRLTRVDYDNGKNITYTYDAAGNRLALVSEAPIIPPDDTAPVILIADPTTENVYVTTNNPITLSGTAWDATGIAALSCTNDTGEQGCVAGTTLWTAGPIALSNGINRLTVSASDPIGNVGQASLTVVVLPPNSGSDLYSLDSDKDGMPDWAEILAGTSPTNCASCLAVKSIVPSETVPGGYELEWASYSGIYYSVNRSTNLMANPSVFIPLKTGIPGLPVTTKYTDTNLPPTDPCFYRISVDF